MKSHSIDISEKNGVRFLHFGSHWVQGAMRIKRPFDLELAYAQDMMAGLLLRTKSIDSVTTSWPRNVLQIGLGAGSLVKWCHHYLPKTKVTAVEINPGVYAAARQFFNLPSGDDRLEIVIADGVEYLQNADQSWDLILLDGYDADGRPGALDSEAFYTLCRDRLSPDGLLATNLLGLARTYEQSLARIANAFDHKVVILPACASGNRVVLGGLTTDLNQDLDLCSSNKDHLRALADQLKSTTHLDLHPLLDRLS